MLSQSPRFAALLLTASVLPVFAEVDAIYKTLRASDPFSVLTWQFPVLAKYSWQRAGLSPFLEAGPSFVRREI